MATLEFVQGVVAHNASLLILLVAFFVCLLLNCLSSPSKVCEIVLTGESISIRNCDLSRNFVESLQSLKMINNCVL
uniref:Movement protein TGBp3 n=1 Tax=Papaya mild mottle associated virus TaxID=2716617 RepID=A0A6G7S7F9_9VIRU|nr:Triple gene block protein 3 [Papaya mild mottle associated virus]